MQETYFISHGSPTLAIDESLPARAFLKSWKDSVFNPQRNPKSILIISAHWETAEPSVTSGVDRYDTIHDFYGFPKHMYQLKYPAPGAPCLAKRVKEVLQSSGFEHVREDKKRGLDHGAWVPLMLMYPEADIPVCQLSIQTDRGAAYHSRLGKALAPLKEEGVLIIGSGSATHNLRALESSPAGRIQPWASEFMQWLNSAILSGRYEEVNGCERKAPHAKMAHPWPDHLYPLHVAMGAAGPNSKAKIIHDSWSLSTLSYTSYEFAADKS